MRLQQYITNEEVCELISYDLYNETLDYLFSEGYTDEGLNEGIKDFLVDIKDKTLKKLSSIFKVIKDDLTELASEMKVDVLDVVDSFRQQDIFTLLKAFGFSIKHLYKSITALSGLVRKGLFSVFKDIHDTGILKDIKKGVKNVDDLIDKHPILNKVGGVAVAGLIFFIWTQMTFIGDLDYDMDFGNIKDALAGKYSLADLFVSPQGMMLIALFASGGLISVPWMGSTIGNLVIALVYTGSKHLKGGKLHNKLKARIHTT